MIPRTAGLGARRSVIAERWRRRVREPRSRSNPLGIRRIVVAATVSSFGDGVAMVGFPLAAASLTSDPRAIGIVAAAEGLPWLLFGLVSGALADRRSRLGLLLIADSARLVISALLALALATGAESVALLAAGAFLVGSFTTVFETAAPPFLASRVGDSGILKANSRLFTGTTLGESLCGPPLGAFLFSLAVAVPFAFNAVSFGLSCLLLATLRPIPRRAETSAHPAADSALTDIKEGIMWLLRSPPLRVLCLASALLNASLTGVLAILVLFAREALGLTNLEYTLLLTTLAVGSLLAGVSVSRLTRVLGEGRMPAVIVVISVASLVTLGSSENMTVSFAAIAATGYAVMAWNVVTVSLRLRIAPSGMQGRLMGAYRLMSYGLGPVGALIAGAAAASWGLRPAIIGMGACPLLIVFSLSRSVTDVHVARENGMSLHGK